MALDIGKQIAELKQMTVRERGGVRHAAQDVEDVLDLSQAGQDRVEACQPISDDEVVVNEAAVGVAGMIAQLLQRPMT